MPSSNMQMQRTNRTKQQAMWLTPLLLLLGILLFCGQAFAQEERPQNRPFADYRHFHLGFHVGIHTQDLILTNQGSALDNGFSPIYGEMPHFSPGFSVGIIANYSPLLNLDIRLVPSLHLGERTLSFSNTDKEEQESFALRSNMIELPLLVKYSSMRLNNIRPYIIGGAYGSLVVGQKKNSVIRFKPFDYGFKIGVGCDIYLRYFKLCPELTLSYGIPNVIDHNRPDMAEDPRLVYTATIKKASTRLILFTINFE